MRQNAASEQQMYFKKDIEPRQGLIQSHPRFRKVSYRRKPQFKLSEWNLKAWRVSRPSRWREDATVGGSAWTIHPQWNFQIRVSFWKVCKNKHRSTDHVLQAEENVTSLNKGVNTFVRSENSSVSIYTRHHLSFLWHRCRTPYSLMSCCFRTRV